MKATIQTIILHIKLSLRSKVLLVHFFIVPLVFYLLIGGVFVSINPTAKETLIATMTVFAVSMGGILGIPYPVAEFYGSEIKRAYSVGGIPTGTVALGNLVSGVINLLLLGAIIFFTAPLIFGAEVPGNLPGYIISLLLIILASVSIGIVFGLCFKNTSKMSMATQLVFLPSIMLSGIMFASELLPDALRIVGDIFPATWGFKAMNSDTVSFSLLLPMLLITALMASVAIFRVHRLKQLT